jgi:hypothetical protein
MRRRADGRDDRARAFDLGIEATGPDLTPTARNGTDRRSMGVAHLDSLAP